MTNLQKRIVSAFVFGALVIGSFIFGAWFYLAVFTFFAWQTCREALALQKKIPSQQFSISALSAAFFVLSVLICHAPYFLAIPVIALGIHGILIGNLFSSGKTPLLSWPPVIILPIYTGLSLASAHLFALQEGLGIRGLIFLFLGIIWISDTAAYFVGRSMGKRPFFPSHSPKKTVEGFLAGWMCGLLFAFAYAYFTDAGLPFAFVCGICIPPLSAMGDLVVSKLKRTVGVKDSGNIMPGHGGLLDRLDGFLAVMPAAALLLYIFAKL